ncbi:MAX network transcriptional repressor b isoform X2 [Oncorhynchus tshawytscha]|uniref:MAX network transcriptional repressor b isoform X2 n=1 Tax=Oncorhynchus tshawytscha TaxID=74940 RepID=UPI001C3D9BFB|nr:MAX network transcriptional repressor b isoform X2 [Oncorhynchus tshawytscha]
MSIDTLLEAARYLEWQAQQQQITHEEERCREKAELHSREAESRRAEVVTCADQPIRFNHVTWGPSQHWPESSQHCQHQHLSPSSHPLPLSLPPPPISIAVIPMVPVVTATPSVPPLPVITTIAAAATSLHLGGTQVMKGGSSPTQQQPIQRQLAAQVKAEPNSMTPQTGGSPSQSQPPIQIPYPTSIITKAASQHALLPQQAIPTQPRPNGTIMDDLRGLDGKRRPGGAGTREVHNKLEKNRRAHLKDCFDTLKKNVPNVDEKKTSNLSVLRSALRYIQTLKRKEKEYEHEMERLAREKISTQQRLAELKNELSQCMDVMEIDKVLRQTVQPEDDQASTSTASGEDNFDQDIDEDLSPPPPPFSLPIIQAKSFLTPHLSITHKNLSSGVLTSPSLLPPSPPSYRPRPPPHPHPTVQVSPKVITHPSVIQAVNHVLPANHKHLTHIAPSPSPASSISQPITAAAAAAHQTITAQPIGHITVHPVAHLGGPLPPHMYPQGLTVSQPTVLGHITHTFTHHTLPHVQASHATANVPQVNGAAVPGQCGSTLGKPTTMLAHHHHHHHHHHPQLVGQTTVLNPVTMVTVPPFPVSTLKLA